LLGEDDLAGMRTGALVSALTGAGLDGLRATIDQAIGAGMEEVEYRLDPADGAALAWLYQHGEVLARQDREDVTCIDVRLRPADRARFEHR